MKNGKKILCKLVAILSLISFSGVGSACDAEDLKGILDGSDITININQGNNGEQGEGTNPFEEYFKYTLNEDGQSYSIGFWTGEEDWRNAGIRAGLADVFDMDEMVEGFRMFYPQLQMTSPLVIPSEYNGLPITKIPEYGFCMSSFSAVSFPDSIIEIGDGSFLCCDGLTDLEIGNSIKTLGDGVFAGCKNLTYVIIGDSITEIAFATFGNCSKLTTVIIPASVTSILDDAFMGCSSLTDVYYKGDIAGWCNISFADLHATPLNNGAKLYINYELRTELVIPDTVTEIKEYAFCGCSNLRNVVIGDSVTTIGGSAFSNCSSLTSVVIGDSVTSIGSAFSDCSSLTSVVIGNSVTSIGSYAFTGCDNLTNVTFKNTEGWEYRSYKENLQSISSEDLADPAKAAELLKTLHEELWYRNA